MDSQDINLFQETVVDLPHTKFKLAFDHLVNLFDIVIEKKDLIENEQVKNYITLLSKMDDEFENKFDIFSTEEFTKSFDMNEEYFEEKVTQHQPEPKYEFDNYDEDVIKKMTMYAFHSSLIYDSTVENDYLL